jgi:hypothetical protein
MKQILLNPLLFALLILSYCRVNAQVGIGGTSTNGSNTNAIITAVPFLTISTDARSGAIGDAGVAVSPDVNSTYWNPSKLAFLEVITATSLSYSPWLRQLLPNVDLAYLSYARKLDERNALGISLRYFNLGTSQLYDENQVSQGTYQPVEFSIDASLARKFGDSFSLGLTVRYIHSSLSNGTFAQGQQTKAGYSVAADASIYARIPTQQFGSDALFAYGIDLSNIGSKISYTDIGQKYFLPINLKIGAANTWYLDSYNEVTFTVDLNKLLVPTPPLRNNGGNIIKGNNDNVSVVSGIFGSFNDAPGGFKEELQEISYSSGIEYFYAKQFAIRVGYFYENPNKGNRQYFTVGAGFKRNDFNLDFSYLIASQQTSPLANTLRFSVGYSFNNTKSR